MARDTPSPAAHAVREDEGQRHAEDKGVSPLSDKCPAGLAPYSEPVGLDDEAPARSSRIDVRFAPHDRGAVVRFANALGIKPSAFVRAAVLDSIDARHHHIESMVAAAVAAPPTPDSMQAIVQLRRVGVNLNQLARAANKGQDVVVDDDLLRESLAAIDDLRSALGDRTRL